jgi:hypothetical protein
MSERDRAPGAGDDEPALSADERAALAAWDTPPPPADFAARVLAARGAAAPAAAPAAPVGRSRRSRIALVAVGLAGAGALAWSLGRSPSPAASRGALAAERRTTVELGARGVAVAEAGAALSWTVDGGGARLSQAAGEVFFRVEPGGPFTVETPAGQITVTGTCFHVEVEAMKAPVQGIVGAAIGAAVIVTVYEGSVLFADRSGGQTRAAAGERIVASGAGGAGAVARLDGDVDGDRPSEAVAAPPADISRDELLLRDKVQRAEIAALRGKLVTLERGGDGGRLARRGDRDDGRPWFDPPAEELGSFVADCKVQLDLPPVMESTPRPVGPELVAELGLEPGEVATFDQAVARLHERFSRALRALYVEVTGDPTGADTLSPDAIASELRDKSPDGEDTRVRRQIARERAGLARPPAELSQRSAYERYFRLLAGLGDELERDLGAALGGPRARAIRAAGGGWPMRMQMAGCGRED